MRHDDFELVKVTPEVEALCFKRTQHLMTTRGLVVAKSNLHRLLAMAYSQGVTDCAQVMQTKEGR